MHELHKLVAMFIVVATVPAFGAEGIPTHFRADWVSPAQLYNVNGNSSSAYIGVTDREWRWLPSTLNVGEQATFQSFAGGASVVSRFPEAAKGRLGLQFSYEDQVVPWRLYGSNGKDSEIVGDVAEYQVLRSWKLAPALAYELLPYTSLGIGFDAGRYYERWGANGEDINVLDRLDSNIAISLFNGSWSVGAYLKYGLSEAHLSMLDSAFMENSAFRLASREVGAHFSFPISDVTKISANWRRSTEHPESLDKVLGALSYSSFGPELELFYQSAVDDHGSINPDERVWGASMLAGIGATGHLGLQLQMTSQTIREQPPLMALAAQTSAPTVELSRSLKVFFGFPL